MAARVATVDFQGIEARRVDVEVQFTSGEAFIVSMGDKAISESRERAGAAFSDLGAARPPDYRQPRACVPAQGEQPLRTTEPGQLDDGRQGGSGGLTARGWTRTLRLARTIADLEGSESVRRVHIAEALIYRRVAPAGSSSVTAG